MGKPDGVTYDELNANYKDNVVKLKNHDAVAFNSRIMKRLNLRPYKVNKP